MAVDLLDRYARESLGTEIRFVVGLVKREGGDSEREGQIIVGELDNVKGEVERALDVLMKEVMKIMADNNFHQGHWIGISVILRLLFLASRLSMRCEDVEQNRFR